MGQLWNRSAGIALVAATIALVGCEATLKETTRGHLEDFISSVSNGAGTIQATLIEGPPPESGPGPTASVSGIGVMINGGSSQQQVSGSASFTRIVVAVQGFENYYQLDLPSGSTQDILLGGAVGASARTMTIRYAVGDAGGIGEYATQSIRFLRVGTGDIQISVSWSDTSDVDLHVVDPTGEEIYFSHKTSGSGGTLDLDSNAGCNRSTGGLGGNGFASNENVVWPTGRAIAGDYRVIVDYWSSCGNASTDYVVTVQRRGVNPQIFTGTFVGNSAPSDTVTTFTY